MYRREKIKQGEREEQSKKKVIERKRRREADMAWIEIYREIAEG